MKCNDSSSYIAVQLLVIGLCFHHKVCQGVPGYTIEEMVRIFNRGDRSRTSLFQGWQVCAEAVITAGKNTVITGSSQTTRVVTNCRKPPQTQK